VDALVVSGIERSSFFWRKSEVGKTLAGAHLSGAQDELVRVDLADSVAVLGEIEFDGSRREPGFESAELGPGQIRRSFLSARARVRPWAARSAESGAMRSRKAWARVSRLSSGSAAIPLT